MHEIKVESLSLEETEHGVTEFWANGAMIAYTIYDDGDLTLRIEPSHDGGPVRLGVRALTEALSEVNRLLAAG